MAVARAFAYVLLVMTCTVVAALGGYQIGVRSNPSEEVSASERTTAVHDAVARAVAKQKAADRRLRRDALRDLAAFQRERFAGELSDRVAEVRLAEAANAARAYKRGKVAGRVTAVKAAEKTAEADAEAEADATAETAEATEPQR